MSNPYEVVKTFERAVCEYTGAPYCVSVTSCTMALLLAVKWHLRGAASGVHSDRRWLLTDRMEIEIPKFTYVSVPASIVHAGGRPTFRDEEWSGIYQLKPLPVFDCARRFTSGMFNPVRPEVPIMLCVSFHASKTLGDTQGGAILHDDPAADAWLRRMRFDGRTEGVHPRDDDFREVGYHAYLSPDVAARLLLKLSTLPRHNHDLPNSDYSDLSTLEIFR